MNFENQYSNANFDQLRLITRAGHRCPTVVGFRLTREGRGRLVMLWGWAVMGENFDPPRRTTMVTAEPVQTIPKPPDRGGRKGAARDKRARSWRKRSLNRSNIGSERLYLLV